MAACQCARRHHLAIHGLFREALVQLRLSWQYQTEARTAAVQAQQVAAKTEQRATAMPRSGTAAGMATAGAFNFPQGTTLPPSGLSGFTGSGVQGDAEDMARLHAAVLLQVAPDLEGLAEAAKQVGYNPSAFPGYANCFFDESCSFTRPKFQSPQTMRHLHGGLLFLNRCATATSRQVWRQRRRWTQPPSCRPCSSTCLPNNSHTAREWRRGERQDRCQLRPPDGRRWGVQMLAGWRLRRGA